MTELESANLESEIFRIENRSTPIKFLTEDDFSLFEFEQNEKLAEVESTHHSAALNFNEPINQLEKMIDQINTSELNCTLESVSNSATEENEKIESKLEEEIKRRLFLERKISELNTEKLELAQKLSISEEKIAKKGILLKTFQSNLTKAVEKWKTREKEFMDYVEKVKSEKQNASFELTKITMRNQLLEQEMKKISDELINEKVKSQEYVSKNSALKSCLDENEQKLNEKNDQIKNFLDKIAELESERDSLKTEIDQINKSLVTEREESKNLKNKIETLNENSQSLANQYDNLKVEYENLINEAKSVIEESERQYTHLTKTIESEKLKKDTLQVEINMLEEKFDHKIKCLVDEYENKITSANNKAEDKEKCLEERHKSEIEQIKSKFQYDLDKTKYKLNEEFKEKINDYESKIFNLNQKIDTLHNEITRLEAANYDLENERNTIRRNLKQQLEMQMKETFEMLGLENENCSKFKQIKSNSVNNLQKISKLESSSCFSLSNFSKSEKLNSSLQHKPTSPLLESVEPTKSVKDEPKPAIKDAFIINQIDLINKYYQIDNSAIQAAGVVAASNSNTCEEVNVTCTSSPKKADSKSDKNNSMNNSRSSELRYYIDMLLNKPPSIMDDKDEPKSCGYHDLSDIEMGYTKKQPADYYDDVKRNLNFDLSDTDQDDSYDETENSTRIQLKNKIKKNLPTSKNPPNKNNHLKI